MALLTNHNNPDSGASAYESTMSQEKDILDIVGMEFAENHGNKYNDSRLSEVTAGNVTIEEQPVFADADESQSTGDEAINYGGLDFYSPDKDKDEDDQEEKETTTTSIIDKPADFHIDPETGEVTNLHTGETVTTEDEQEEITEIIEEPAKKLNATSSKIKKIGLWGIVAVGAYFLLKK